MFYHPPQDGTSVQTVAARFTAAVFHKGDEAYRNQLRSAGFPGPVLQYLMANEASGPPNLRDSSSPCGSYRYYQNNVSGIAGDFCSSLHQNEGNFLHNGRGERLYKTQSWQESTGTKTVYIYLMNPASQDWRAYFARRAQENLQSLEYTGIFLDNVDLTLYRALRQELNSDGIVGEYATENGYREAVTDFLATVRSQLADATLWANMTGGSDSSTDWDVYAPYLDGIMNEYFVARWNDTYASQTAWESQIRQAERALGQGKSLLLVGQGAKADLERMRFALASYLLVASSNSHFRYTSDADYEEAWLYNDYQTRLGRPTSGRYQLGSLWQRDFACGSVRADPARHLGTLTIDAARPGCS